MFELYDDYFDLASITKTSNEDGTYTVAVEGEHVSYRLNNSQFNEEYFTEYGSPSYILGQILNGTGFSVGSVEFSDTVTYSAQEPKSRRQILMEFIALLNGEIIFNKFTIGIARHRGSSSPKPAIKDRNVTVVSRTVNKRKIDEQGNPFVSYSCSPINLPSDNYTLGDEVLLIQKPIGVNEKLRVVSISRNPYDEKEAVLQFSNYSNGLEDSLYRIETSAVIKDSLYNGIRIGPEFGFEAIRNDKRARAYFRSDGLAMQSGDGTGDNWKDRLYYAYDSATDETILVYDGKLSVDLLNAISGIITPYVYSENGAIVNAIVRRLRTDLSKPWRYLNGDSSDVHYQDIGDTDISAGRYFEVDIVDPDSEPVQFSIPAIDSYDGGVLLWWFEGVEGGSMTTNPEYAVPEGGGDPVPVMAYKYINHVQHRIELKQTVQGWWGVRSQWGVGEDDNARGAGLIEKTDKYMQMTMNKGNGNEIGGVRISSGKGVELFNPTSKVWEYPGSGGALGNFDALEIGNDYFKVEVQDKVYEFELRKDSYGRITHVIDSNKDRTVSYE
jgi:hypothetical protein